MATKKPSSKTAPVIVTGVQPSGQSHIGNYAGAYQNMVALQKQAARRFYFIADYHSLSEDYDPAEKRQQVMNLAADLLAIGVDPKKTTLFLQSDVPEHLELCWIFNTITPVALLERMTQYKDKAARQAKNINAALLTYPVLQAADILIYKADRVPVGHDQIQHLELTRDVARLFNNRFGQTFPETKPLLTETPKLKSLTDPLKKMSKSHGDRSCLYLNDDPDAIYRKLKSAVTESTGILKYSEEELDHRLSLHAEAHQAEDELRGQAGAWNLLTILKLVGGEKEAKLILAGQPIKYGELKKVVAERIAEHFADFRTKRAELIKDTTRIKRILAEGAKKARREAVQTLKEARRAIGID